MATPKKPKDQHLKRGRPETITPAKLAQLEQAFSIGASDLEACAFADIAGSVLYAYQERHPEFVERKNRLKEQPTLLARQSVVGGLRSDPHLALKYLERKKKDEFSLKQEVEHSGDAARPIVVIDAGPNPYSDDGESETADSDDD